MAVVRVPESQPSSRSASVTGAIDGASVRAEYEQASMGTAFERLGRILGAALASARESFGHEATSDPFNGLYITPAHAERCWEGATAGVVTRVDRADIRPGWADICRCDPRWEWLRATYHLSEFELDLVLVALASEVDLRYEKVFGYLQDDIGQKVPTVGFALDLLSADVDEKVSCRAVFSADAPLLGHRVLALGTNPRSPSTSLLGKYLQLDQQIVDVLLGVGGLDPRLSMICSLSRPRADTADNQVTEIANSLLPVVQETWASQPLTIYLHGPSGTAKHGVAAAIAAQLGVPLLSARAGLLAQDHTLETQLVVLFREALLHGALLFVDEFDSFDRDHSATARAVFGRHLAGYRGVTVLAGTSGWVPLDGAPLGVLVVPFTVPDLGQRRAMWSAALQARDMKVPRHDIDALASRFKFSAERIHDAVQTASNSARIRASGQHTAAATVGELFAAARGQCGRELSALARKIEPIYDWDDIVLPTDAMAQLRELCLRVAHRERVMGEWGFDRITAQGKGVSALFAGPPGTGKTMAAEVITRDLGVDLYKIDLSSVVSKYIGETEKNLERIFAAALQANACLLFDEADAIFGKRSEVHDSHDRYANLEISYLLQRMEDYDGLAILTTNRRDYLDEAFTRRLEFIVDFPLPTEDQRLRIWQVRMPPEAPWDSSVDLSYLARTYPLAGGNISSIALRAAFLAAAENRPITMGDVICAVHREYRKMGKVVPVSGTDSRGAEP